MKVPWVKRVLFGNPARQTKNKLTVSLRRSDDNTPVTHWTNLTGTKPVRFSTHENGLIQIFADPGLYSINVSDGANTLILENETIFLDISQLDELVEPDPANDKLVCWDSSASRYVLVTINDFFAVS